MLPRVRLAHCVRASSHACDAKKEGTTRACISWHKIRSKTQLLAPVENLTAVQYLILGDKPAGVVRVLVDELLGLFGAGEEEDGTVAGLQERPPCAREKKIAILLTLSLEQDH